MTLIKVISYICIYERDNSECLINFLRRSGEGVGGGGQAESGLSPDEYPKVFQLSEISRHAPFRAPFNPAETGLIFSM